MEADRLSRELAERLEAARITAEALSLGAGLARDTVGRWIRGTTVPTPAALRAVEDVLSRRLGYPVDLAAAIKERRSARQRDRQPTDGAKRAEIAVYLRTLIRWLNADPWARDPRLGGTVLTPSDIEQKLAITDANSAEEGDLDADGVADRCTRLVILGGPGAGKTWLARRAARRCAEVALEALAGGASLDEVELPLFTTCSLLAKSTEGIRDAAVSSALNQLGDLGSWRMTALREFFTERDASTLLVIDGLDEARNPDYWLRLSDSLPWRIVATTRPSSWRQQLTIDAADSGHMVGSLQPLTYPQAVESVIARWFTADPPRGRALAAQIESRVDLQQGATVPLILTFYCIIGGDQPLPTSRHQVHELVLWRLLSGLWRGSSTDGNPAKRAAYLRRWAREGAKKNEMTGVGTWADEILTSYIEMSNEDRAAVDHVAVPVRLPDLATGATLRRFVHRSVREYLTAQHVAQMTAAEAVAELLNHLWYDPDWEYTAPFALAMHPERDQILKQLLERVIQFDSTGSDLVGIDGCWELRRFLTRVAEESREASWSNESATIIGQARLDVAANDRFRLPAAPGWLLINRQIRREILAQMDAAGPEEIRWFIEALDGFSSEPSDLAHARSRILSLMDTADTLHVPLLAENLCRLNPKAEDLSRARNRVLSLLDLTGHWHAAKLAGVLGSLESGSGDLARARGRILDLLDATAHPEDAGWYTEVLATLGPEPGDLARARGRILDLLDAASDPEHTARLTETLNALEPGSGDLARARGRILDLLDATAHPEDAGWYTEVLATLGPEPGDLARARGRILDLLDAASDPEHTARLTETLNALEPGSGDLARARGRILDLLEAGDDLWDIELLAAVLIALNTEHRDLARARRRVLGLLDITPYASSASRLAIVLSDLNPAAVELFRARRRVLDLLDRQDSNDKVDCTVWLAEALGRLSPEPYHLARARNRVLDLLADNDIWDAAKLTEVLDTLGPEPGDLAQARSQVLGLLDTSTDPWHIQYLPEALTRLSPEPSDLGRARGRLLDLLMAADPSGAAILAKVVSELSPEPGDLARARGRVLNLLETHHGEGTAEPGALAQAVCKLSPESSDLARARSRLLDLIDTTRLDFISWPARILGNLEPDPGDLARARGRMLDLLEATESASGVGWAAESLAILGTEPGDNARVRGRVLDLLKRGNYTDAPQMIEMLSTLDPTAADLAECSAWSIPPGHNLLASVRRNSPLQSWLEILPTLAGLPGQLDLRHAISRQPTTSKVEIRHAEGVIAAELGLKPGATIVSRHEERFIDNKPYALQTSFYPMTLVEQGATRLIEARSIEEGVSRYLRDTLAIRESGIIDRVTVRTPSEREQAFFKLACDVAVLEIRRQVQSGSGKPVRLTVTVIRSGRYQSDTRHDRSASKITIALQKWHERTSV